MGYDRSNIQRNGDLIDSVCTINEDDDKRSDGLIIIILEHHLYLYMSITVLEMNMISLPLNV